MGRYTDDRDALPLGSVVEMPCTAAVVGDFVRTGEVLLKSEWPQLAASFADLGNYAGWNISASPSPAVGTPRYPFVFGGQTYYSSSGTGFYQLVNTDQFKSIATKGLPGAAGRVAVLNGILYCVSSNDLYQSADLLNWSAVRDAQWYNPTELLGATSTDLYLRATQLSNGSLQPWKMSAATKVFSLVAMAANMSYPNSIYPEGNVLVGHSSTGATPYIKVSRDAGVTWEDFKASTFANGDHVGKGEDGTVFVGNSTLLSNSNAVHLSNDGWVTSFQWTSLSSWGAMSSICKVGTKFVAVAEVGSGSPTYVFSALASTVGSVATSDATFVGTRNTWTDELSSSAAAVIHSINGKVTLAFPEVVISFPAGTGNTLVLSAIAGRTVRTLPSDAMSVLWDGRVLTNGIGYFCIYNPDTGEFTGPSRRSTFSADFGSTQGLRGYLRGVGLINGDVFIYHANAGTVFNYTVITAAGLIQTGAVILSDGLSSAASMYVMQSSADTLMTYSTYGTAQRCFFTTTNGRIFTLANTANVIVTKVARTRSGVLVCFDAANAYVSRDYGKTWSVFAFTTTNIYAVTDEGILHNPSTTRIVLSSLDGGFQIGADLPVDYISGVVNQNRFFEFNKNVFAAINTGATLYNQRQPAAPAVNSNSTIAGDAWSAKCTDNGDIRMVMYGSNAPYAFYLTPKQNTKVDKATQFKVPAVVASKQLLSTYVKGR